MIKNKNSWRGGTPQYRKEASVRFVSETSERRSEVRLIGGDSYE